MFYFQQFDYNVPRCDFLCIFPAWGSLSFQGLLIDIFLQIQKHFDHYFLKVILYLNLSSYSRTAIIHILDHLKLPIAHCSFSFFQPFFPSVSITMANSYVPIFNFTDLSFCSFQSAINSTSKYIFQMLYFTVLEFPVFLLFLLLQ